MSEGLGFGEGVRRYRLLPISKAAVASATKARPLVGEHDPERLERVAGLGASLIGPGSLLSEQQNRHPPTSARLALLVHATTGLTRASRHTVASAAGNVKNADFKARKLIRR